MRLAKLVHIQANRARYEEHIKSMPSWFKAIASKYFNRYDAFDPDRPKLFPPVVMGIEDVAEVVGLVMYAARIRNELQECADAVSGSEEQENGVCTDSKSDDQQAG